MGDSKTLHIELQPNGVSAPAQKAVIVAARVVKTLLRAVEADDMTERDIEGAGWNYRFGGLDLSAEEWRKTHEAWVLSKGFHDLARGVRETLEAAVFYLEMIQMKSGPTTWARVQAQMDKIRKRAAGYRFPQLLETVNAGLREPMAFEAEFRSLQKVRNCLEHRGGVVEDADIDTKTGLLTLTFPRLKVFYLRGGEEVEVPFGEVIDTHDADNPEGSDHGADIFIRRVSRSRDFALSEPIVISASDFFEIAMACHLFAGDIASKLPTLAPTTEREGAVRATVD